MRCYLRAESGRARQCAEAAFAELVDEQRPPLALAGAQKVALEGAREVAIGLGGGMRECDLVDTA